MEEVSADWVTLRIFLAAIELGSITRAARRCAIAPSAAAKRLSLLEHAAGSRLLERGARGVRPTPAGEALAQHARALFALSARFGDDLRAFAAGGLGTVRLRAAASVIAGTDLGEVLSAFRRAHRGVRVEVREDTSSAIVHDLAEGRADLGLITSAGEPPPLLESDVWREDRLVALMHADHPLAGQGKAGFAAILDHPLIVLQPGGALSLLLADAARRLGRTPDIIGEVTGTDAARTLVAAGIGIAIIPDGLARPFGHLAALRRVELDEGWAMRRLRLVARRAATLPPAARLLRDHLLGSAFAGGAR